MNHDRLLIATTTVATREQADDLAQTLVAQRLAACVQIDGPITSHYIWNDQCEHATEWRLTIKTRLSIADKLQQRVLQSHPYDVPQWASVVCDGVASDYWDWVQQSVPADPQIEAMHPLHVYIYGRNGEALTSRFEDVVNRLSQVDRLHIELDGSFVWVGPNWQLDGMIYDHADRIRHIDLKGHCTREPWRSLIGWLADPTGKGCTTEVTIREANGQVLHDLQSFERMHWPEP
jgi:periplasmic divalent cation tolerance protein